MRIIEENKKKVQCRRQKVNHKELRAGENVEEFETKERKMLNLSEWNWAREDRDDRETSKLNESLSYRARLSH